MMEDTEKQWYAHVEAAQLAGQEAADLAEDRQARAEYQAILRRHGDGLAHEAARREAVIRAGGNPNL